MQQTEEQKSVPRHIGYILDGNRRWAKSHGLPTYEGHLAGYDALKQVIFETAATGVEYVSIYAFSTENWKRGEGEVGKLMKLALHAFKKDLHEFIERGIRIRVMGVEDGLSDKLIAASRDAEAKTAHLTASTLCICFNYGGQREIVDAARSLIKEGVEAEEVTEELFAERLYVPDVPPVDLVVRTSGEQRLSNFMLWRIAYSEFIFLEKYWPDMRPRDVHDIIETYNTRHRRIGK